ncbi:MAG TPA: AbrB/MazE/SpoVT family DNA-binding domain-containing protein [Candidatus Acidoferrales bacterium]|nr:AbrB/MazE/SpoVT family DNA-binding domain-containing protein [Candidatus Acidoferrales bacterium]
MKTKLSTKGQVVLPGSIRQKLGLQPGDELDASIRNGEITLRPKRKRRFKARIVTDPILGTPVVTFGPGGLKRRDLTTNPTAACFSC